MHWPHGQCARLWIKGFRLEPWPGTLCCVLGQDTLHVLSQCLSPTRCVWDIPAIDKYLIQGGVEILLVTSCYWNCDKHWPDVTWLIHRLNLMSPN